MKRVFIHAFIMDPLEKVKPWKDTTCHLMRAAVERGHRVCWLEQHALWLEHDQLHATVEWLEAGADASAGAGADAGADAATEWPLRAAHREAIALTQADVVWIRTDPPFDRRYLYTTLLLDHLPAATRVLNRPSALRNWNEKLAALLFPEYTPPTVVTNDCARIMDFARTHGRIILKPIDGFAGKGIVFYRHGADARIVRAAVGNGRRWVLAQAYLPAVSRGDRRILLLNGEPLGGILRVNPDGSDIHNLDAGGSAHPLKLEQRDLDICAALKPALSEQGVFLAGIDIIGGMLIEVNITSPTGLREMCRFNGEDYHHQIIAALE